MAVDEIEAFERARTAASNRGWQWRPPFWIALSGAEWLVQAESECVIRVLVETGETVPEAKALDPAVALAVAKEHAGTAGLSWKPSFSLQLEEDRWIVGACQSQLGGQVSVEVDHSGAVVRSFVNPK